MQTQKVFFDYTRDRRLPHLPTPPSDEQIRVALSHNNRRCPLSEVIVSRENEGNMRELRRLAFTALKRYNRSCRGCNFGLFAGAGQGKTYVAKQFAKTIGIPFIFVQSASLVDTWQLFELIQAKFAEHQFHGDALVTPPHDNWGFPKIVEWQNPDDSSDYTVPPCIVFLDEAHQIPRKMMLGGLLNAMERDDGYMQARPAGAKADTITINMREVCWVAATTERGRLFDALEMRLQTSIEWAPANAFEVTAIVKMRMDEYTSTGELPFSMPIEACQLVAKYRRVPREAISFAYKAIQQKDMMPSDTWEEAVKQVASDIGVDDGGLSLKQITILTALGQRPIAETRLAGIANCRIEQVQRFELPALMSYDNGPFIVAMSGKGMCITEAGLRELDKRGIPHEGYRVTAEHFEAKR
jgi:SpoVK/Ycf46/Vps4 family AAA+-type ATPase